MKKIFVLFLATCFLCSLTSAVAIQNQSPIKTYDDKNTSQLIFEDSIPLIIEQIDESMMTTYLMDLVSFGPHSTASPACDKVAEYIFNQFENLGLDVRYQDWYYNIFTYGRNIEATLKGLSNDIYIISAHYDTLLNCPGADDDAAGVAAVLTAATVLSQYSFNHTIRFVLFSGEEQGLHGSRSYAEEAYNKCDNIIASINLDMIGYASNSEEEGKIRIYENAPSSWIVDEYTIPISQQYAELLDFEVLVFDDPTGHDSDYLSFWKFGHDALFYHEYKWNSYIHTTDDTIENMNIHYATKVARFAIATIAELAISPIIDNSKPEIPTLMGPSKGKINVNQTYTTYTTDLDENNLYYMFDWGDGTNSGWLGPYASSDEVNASHFWEKKGHYNIKVKAKDICGSQSGWSSIHPFSTPRTFLFEHHLLLNLFKILQRAIDFDFRFIKKAAY
jgi:hypothetical protein